MADRPYVFICRGIPAQERAILDEFCETKMYDGLSGLRIPRSDFLRGVKGADGIFVIPPDQIDTELLDAAGPQLKVVGTMSVGLEHIDLQECARRGVKVGYTPDVLTDAVAEEAIGLTLATSRRFKEGMAEVTNGGWHTTWNDSLYLCGADVKNSTVGIVGLGRIGLAVAKRLLPFGIEQLLYCGHSPKDHAREVGAEFVSFDELLSKSDFIICCCSMNPENIGLFNKDAFAKMKKNAILINVSRGALVNPDDLYDALKSGQILAAGLDCTKPEPIPLDSPLLTLNNCTILPHLGSASTSVRHVMVRLTAQNILAGLKGEPLPNPAPM